MAVRRGHVSSAVSDVVLWFGRGCFEGEVAAGIRGRLLGQTGICVFSLLQNNCAKIVVNKLHKKRGARIKSVQEPSVFRGCFRTPSFCDRAHLISRRKVHSNVFSRWGPR